jgi:hypothetical protein
MRAEPRNRGSLPARLTRCDHRVAVATPTADELAILGLAPDDSLPGGGQVLDVEVRSGNGSASIWSHIYGPTFRELCGIPLWPGTLNLWAASPVTWDSPTTYKAHEFCPIILEECAVGVVLRWADPTFPRKLEFLEVLSPVELRPRLGGVRNEQWINVRLLSGQLLR